MATTGQQETPDITLVVPNTARAIIVSNSLQALGVAQLAACCASAGVRCRIVDAFLEGLSPDATAARVLQQRPTRAIGFYVPSESTLHHALRTIARIRPADRGVRVVMGGPFATMASQAILETFPYVDAVILGEAEEALLEWLDACPGPRSDWGRIRNLAYLNDCGAYSENPLRPLRAGLDNLPFPDREQTLPVLRSQGGNLSLVGSRGCHGTCTFCLVQAFWQKAPGKKWRGCSAERVIDEMAHIVHRFNQRTIAFVDDNFFGPGQWAGTRAIRIAQLLERRKLDVRFSIMCRPDDILFNLPAVRALAKAGLRKVFLGVEAGSLKTLRVYQKRLTPDQSRAAIHVLTELGIHVLAGAVLFHPWMSLNEVDDNLDFWRRLLEDYPSVAAVVFGEVDILQGTPMQIRLEKEGRLSGSVFSVRRSKFVVEEVSRLSSAWAKIKHQALYPAYVEFTDREAQNGKRGFDLFFSRAQVTLLRDLVARVRKGEQDIDRLVSDGISHPVVKHVCHQNWSDQ